MIPGLLSDRQIVELVANGDMIAPFIDHQVNGRGIISYGVSSFGYDARIAPNEYKLFRNNDTLVVDPKNFNPNVCYDVTDDMLIIPPHGFALARTVEYLKIPNDVIVISVGKSSYARCFSGSTLVAMADGTSKSFLELIAMDQAKQVIMGVSLDPRGNPIPKQLIAPRKIGTEAVLNVTVSDGSTFCVTPDHMFLTKNVDGTLGEIPASQLQPNTQHAQFSYHTAEPQSVKMIYPMRGVQDVYCLTAPDYGNFLLSSGFGVKNCGLVTGITPLEPGWEGHVTIELSNTTSLPSYVYGGEGICQFLFFKGSVACLQTYKERQGKYQGQTGVTLPRVIK